MSKRSRLSTRRAPRLTEAARHQIALAVSPVLWHRPEMSEYLRQVRDARTRRASPKRR